MTSILYKPNINNIDESTRNIVIDKSTSYWKNYHKKVTLLSVSGAFLIIVSLIVAVSSLLCFALPGINVVNSIILPGVLPAIIGLSVGLPIFIIGARNGRAKAKILDEWATAIKQHLDTVLSLQSNQENYLRDLFATEKYKFEKRMVIQAVLKKYPKPNDEEKPIVDLLNHIKP